MDKFSEIVYAVLPWALGFLAFLGIVIFILKCRIAKIESQPKIQTEQGSDLTDVSAGRITGRTRTGDSDNH